MDLKAHARQSLTASRGFLDRILDDFETREDWLYQANAKANHAMWIVAHLGLADNQFASIFAKDTQVKPDGWDELFWFGSELRDDQSDYPDHNVVLSYFRDRRENLLSVLDSASDERLTAPAPPKGERSPIAGAPCIGHIFLFAAYHEGIHSGQLTVAHRGLGHAPKMAPRSG